MSCGGEAGRRAFKGVVEVFVEGLQIFHTGRPVLVRGLVLRSKADRLRDEWMGAVGYVLRLLRGLIVCREGAAGFIRWAQAGGKQNGNAVSIPGVTPFGRRCARCWQRPGTNTSRGLLQTSDP